MMDDFMAEIERLCKKTPEELTTMEIAFLRARKTYLTGFQLKQFESVLGEIKAKLPETVLKKKTEVKKI
jgi:hypothetical protein